jgi:DNA-binding CsgD family transcriptional regulator
MLAGALRSLIEAPGGVRMLDWYSDELNRTVHQADVVVLDIPPSLHEQTFAAIAGRFLGPVVVLLQEGEREEDLPPGQPSVVLYRPLQISELWTAIASPSTSEHGSHPPVERPQSAGPPFGRRPIIANRPTLIASLSARELEVLGLLAAGKSNPAIAQELVITLDTVKRHITHILDKLGAANRTEAVTRARELELLP